MPWRSGRRRVWDSALDTIAYCTLHEATLNRGRVARTVARLAAPVLLLIATGCAVPQPRGAGKLEHLEAPGAKRGYWRYLPKEYVQADAAGQQARRWPLVVTFHGMKPFDRSLAQALEWEQEADRYGFIVVAPDLRAPDVFAQFPVRQIKPDFKSDEDATLAILNHIFATTHADPGNVLATSWSSGGYMAHYMVNQHPGRFTCLGVRQSNFSSTVLDAAQTARSRYHPILILSTQHDFSGVKTETHEAIRWYEAHQYANFAWVEIKELGHERTPDMAAAFFARVADVEPNQQPVVLVRRQAIAGNARGLALLAGGLDRPQLATGEKGTPSPLMASAAGPAAGPPRATIYPAGSAADTPAGVRGAARGNNVARPAPPPSQQPVRPAAPPPPRSPVSIRVSSAIGTEPFVLAFSADCPADWQRNADFLWTLNGDTICSGVNGEKTIAQAGEHTLGLLVVTSDGQEHRAYRLIRVLPHIESTHSARSPESH